MSAQSQLNTLSAADKRIRQLGATMFELDRSSECTRSLLRAEGFSNHELDTYGDAARTYADGLTYRDGDAPPHQGFTKTDEEIVAIAVDAGFGLVGDAQIAGAALARGLTPQQIARNWQKITRLVALKLGTLPVPQALTAREVA